MGDRLGIRDAVGINILLVLLLEKRFIQYESVLIIMGPAVCTGVRPKWEPVDGRWSRSMAVCTAVRPRSLIMARAFGKGPASAFGSGGVYCCSATVSHKGESRWERSGLGLWFRRCVLLFGHG